MDWSIAAIAYLVAGIVSWAHCHIVNYPILYWDTWSRLKATAFLVLLWPVYVAQSVIEWFRR